MRETDEIPITPAINWQIATDLNTAENVYIISMRNNHRNMRNLYDSAKYLSDSPQFVCAFDDAIRCIKYPGLRNLVMIISATSFKCAYDFESNLPKLNNVSNPVTHNWSKFIYAKRAIKLHPYYENNNVFNLHTRDVIINYGVIK